jgi:CRP-like cAMP-binding protein
MGAVEEMVRGLKTYPLLSKLPEEDLARLADVMEPRTFPAGEEILREGDEGDEMFLLLEGRVDVLKTTPFGDRYVTASLLDSYHCSFGEMALIDRGPRSATIRAKTECRTLCLSREAFQEFCRTCPKVGLELLMSISVTLVRDLRRENENLHIVYQALIEEIENG